MPSISPSQQNVLQALRSFLVAILPIPANSIVSGYNNRVPEPLNTSFVIFYPLRFERFATNVDSNADCKIIGSITGNQLNVTAVDIGTIAIGSALSGTGALLANTIIGSQVSGTPGGIGIYQVSNPQTLASQVLSCGQQTLVQDARVVVQVDFHSAPGIQPDAGDMAQIVSTSLRDEFGVDFFAALAPPLNGVVPLYADDPRFISFLNDQNQWESRWSLDVHLEVLQAIVYGQQYADAATVELVDVDVVYPPA